MTKLHEVLAVESDKEGIAKRILDETKNLFKNKHNIFMGMSKTLKMDKEGMESVEEAAAEQTDVTTTVPDRLEYTAKALEDWFDVTLTKEKTNYQSAVADLQVDGVVIATSVPATFLLGLESKLKMVRQAYEQIPTLDAKVRWEEDLTGTKNTYVSKEPEVRAKTQKQPNFTVLYEATDKHPAQIEKWMEETTIGKYETYYRSGMISSAKKAQLLGNIDKLIQATKQARMRANSVEIDKGEIGQSLFNFINS